MWRPRSSPRVSKTSKKRLPRRHEPKMMPRDPQEAPKKPQSHDPLALPRDSELPKCFDGVWPGNKGSLRKRKGEEFGRSRPLGSPTRAVKD